MMGPAGLQSTIGGPGVCAVEGGGARLAGEREQFFTISRCTVAPIPKKTGEPEIGGKWTALPTGPVNQSQVRKAPKQFPLCGTIREPPFRKAQSYSQYGEHREGARAVFARISAAAAEDS